MFEAEEAHWWYAGMRSISFGFLNSRATLGETGRLLDAGCGTGNNLVHLGQRGHAFGLDLSEEALRFCRTRGVVVARGSVLSLPFRDDAFDLVTSFDVLYHRWVADDRAAVVELARVLRPGGLLLLRLPALEWLRRAHDEAVHTRHRYTRGEVRALLAAAGLELVCDTYCNTLLLPVVALRGLADAFFGPQDSDLAPVPRPLAAFFAACLGIESWLVRHVSLPLGASVVTLARKPMAVRMTP